MSRIHEALKRAEEERAAQGHHADALPALQPMDIGSEISDPLSTASMPPMTGAAAPGFGNAFTFDMLMARSQRANWNPDQKTMLFFNPQEQAYGTEQFRTLRSRLYQIREKQPLKKVLISSALPKEGKSFVAANLAQAMVRQHGRRALLIDADLRGARLHQALGATSTPGLAEYLLGEQDEFAVMQRGPMENLFFIPAGRLVSNPAELVANGRFKFLLNRVEALFDWIIIDSPPAIPVSDPSLLANYCDGVLMVVRSNATPFDAARKARQEFADKTLIGVVLNGVDVDKSSYSNYYYGSYPGTSDKA